MVHRCRLLLSSPAMLGVAGFFGFVAFALTCFRSVFKRWLEVFLLPALEGFFLTFFNSSPASCDQEAFPLI